MIGVVETDLQDLGHFLDRQELVWCLTLSHVLGHSPPGPLDGIDNHHLDSCTLQ